MDECATKGPNNITVLYNYIGQDHHYKGAEMERKYQNEIKKNKNYGNGTYFTFLNKLLTSIS